MSNDIKKEESAKDKKGSKKWLVGLLIAALILLWVAPPLAAELYLRENIGNLMKADTPREVRLDTNTFKLITGSFEELEVKGDNLTIGNLQVESYELLASSGKINVFETLREKDVIVKESPVADLTLHITIEDIKNLLKSYYESLNDIEVVAYDGYLQINGVSDTPRGKEVPISFNAELSSSDWSSLQIEPIALSVDSNYEGELGQEEIQELIDVYSIDISFEDTNPPIFIDSVNVDTKEVLITANTSLS
ncbi:MAG: LmeA family phospholipid-binding protein [Clostridia bacterium]